MLYRTLILFLGIVVGVVVSTIIFWDFKYWDTRDEDGHKIGFFRRGIVALQHKRKRANLEKLRSYLKDKNQITNDEVEKLLRVSHATAARYLDQLEDEKLIEQVGETGRGTYYRSKK